MASNLSLLQGYATNSWTLIKGLIKPEEVEDCRLIHQKLFELFSLMEKQTSWNLSYFSTPETTVGAIVYLTTNLGLAYYSGKKDSRVCRAIPYHRITELVNRSPSTISTKAVTILHGIIGFIGKENYEKMFGKEQFFLAQVCSTELYLYPEKTYQTWLSVLKEKEDKVNTPKQK